MASATINEGLYVPTNIGKRAHIWHRYVLGQVSGMVRYSRGGTQHFCCQAVTFEKWIKRYECQHKPKVSDKDTLTSNEQQK